MPGLEAHVLESESEAGREMNQPGADLQVHLAQQWWESNREAEGPVHGLFQEQFGVEW